MFKTLKFSSLVLGATSDKFIYLLNDLIEIFQSKVSEIFTVLNFDFDYSVLRSAWVHTLMVIKLHCYFKKLTFTLAYANNMFSSILEPVLDRPITAQKVSCGFGHIYLRNP